MRLWEHSLSMTDTAGLRCIDEAWLGSIQYFVLHYSVHATIQSWCTMSRPTKHRLSHDPQPFTWLTQSNSRPMVTAGSVRTSVWVFLCNSFGDKECSPFRYSSRPEATNGVYMTSYAHIRDETWIFPSEQGSDTMWSTSLTAFFRFRAPNVTIGMYGTVEAAQKFLLNIRYV
jgi:hypothetical protein